MVFVTAAWLILLGILGMAPLPELPVNDKALHFVGVSAQRRELSGKLNITDGTVADMPNWTTMSHMLISDGLRFFLALLRIRSTRRSRQAGMVCSQSAITAGVRLRLRPRRHYQ